MITKGEKNPYNLMVFLLWKLWLFPKYTLVEVPLHVCDMGNELRVHTFCLIRSLTMWVGPTQLFLGPIAPHMLHWKSVGVPNVQNQFACLAEIRRLKKSVSYQLCSFASIIDHASATEASSILLRGKKD